MPKTRYPLVCVPGYCDSKKMFGLLKRSLKHKRKVLALSFPVIRKKNHSLTLRQLSNFIDQFTKKHKLKKYILVGFSSGGLIATYHAQLHPKSIASLYLLNSSPRLILSPFLRSLYPLAKPLLLTPFFCRLYASLNTAPQVRKLFKGRPLSKIKTKRIRRFPVSIYRTLFGFAGRDLTNPFNRLSVPKFIVVFKDDRVLPLSKFKPYFDQLNTNLVIFKRGSHLQKKLYWKNIASLFK